MRLARSGAKMFDPDDNTLSVVFSHEDVQPSTTAGNGSSAEVHGPHKASRDDYVTRMITCETGHLYRVTHYRLYPLQLSGRARTGRRGDTHRPTLARFPPGGVDG